MEATEARPRTKAGQRAATTSALIIAGRKLFAEKGYAAVSTREIVEQAGVTRASLYNHFKRGKEDLFAAVLVQLSAQTARQVRAAAAAAEDPWEGLVAGVEAFLEAWMSPDVQRILLIDGPSVLGSELWQTANEEFALRLLESVVQRASDAGETIDQPAPALAQVLLAALDEAAMVVARADDHEQARAEMGQTVRRLLEGLRAPTT